MKNSKQVVDDLIRPIVESLGFELWGIDYIQQGKYSILRIYIEKESGITLDDCEFISKQVSAILDVEDPIKTQYSLEVSSPGLNRTLYNVSQLQRYIHNPIEVKMCEAIHGTRRFQGQLQRIENDNLILLIGEKELVLPIINIEKANLLMGP